MTVLNLQVTASSDDAIEVWGAAPVLDDIAIQLSGADDFFGFRLLNATIPQGATINTAVLSLYNLQAGDVTMRGIIYANDVDNAATFTTTDGNIEGRALTTANVVWSATFTFSAWNASPDIANVIQEIVDRVGWASGNALAILVKSTTGADATVRTWDNDTARGAKLDIDYTAAAGGIAPLRRRIENY